MAEHYPITNGPVARCPVCGKPVMVRAGVVLAHRSNVTRLRCSGTGAAAPKPYLKESAK